MDLLKRLEAERSELLKKIKHAQREVAQLVKHMAVIRNIEKGFAKGRVTGKRTISAAGRRKISEAQKARWAKKKTN